MADFGIRESDLVAEAYVDLINPHFRIDDS